MKIYNTELHKLTILNENRNKSGIYRWVNNISGKSYIGSSRSLSKRELAERFMATILNVVIVKSLSSVRIGYSLSYIK